MAISVIVIVINKMFLMFFEKNKEILFIIWLAP